MRMLIVEMASTTERAMAAHCPRCAQEIDLPRGLQPNQLPCDGRVALAAVGFPHNGASHCAGALRTQLYRTCTCTARAGLLAGS